jgi:Lhr-like helicase
MRLSNLQPDIRLVFREVKSGINGKRFPELDWVVNNGRTTIIFCRTINLSARVYGYLLRQDRGDPDSLFRRMRMYNSLNWPTYNETTQDLVNRNECCLVVGTSALSVGADLDTVQDVVIFGDPESPDELLQQIGRILPKLGGQTSDSSGIVYFFAKGRERAEETVRNWKPGTGIQESGGKKKG